MGDVISEGTRAGGLGLPTARGVMVVVWVCGVVLGLMGDPFTIRAPWPATAFAAALIGALLLTTPGGAPLPPRRVVWIPAIGLYVTAVALAVAVAVEQQWALVYVAFVVTFLFVRGNPVAASVGSLLMIGYAIWWAVPQHPTADEYAALLGVPIGSVVAAVVWRVVLRGIVRRERAHRGEEARAATRTAAAADAAAAASRELEQIRSVALPLLERLADGEPVDATFRRRLVRDEAALRDRIRAPQLQHPTLVSAVDQARGRGVSVVLLGEAAVEGQRVGDDLAASIARALDPLHGGRVTIRSLPEGRVGAVSVVTQSTDRTEQVHLDAEGGEVRRS